MSKLAIVKPAVVVRRGEPLEAALGEAHVVSVVNGMPASLDGIAPVITVQLADVEQDAARLLRAAEQLLPLHHQATGMVVLDEKGEVQGVIPRRDLEDAVLHMRRGEYSVLAKELGLRGDYRPPAGDMSAPFVYWRCPQCGLCFVPRPGHEDDPPPLCRLHEAPVQMERHVRGAE